MDQSKDCMSVAPPPSKAVQSDDFVIKQLFWNLSLPWPKSWSIWKKTPPSVDFRVCLLWRTRVSLRNAAFDVFPVCVFRGRGWEAGTWAHYVLRQTNSGKFTTYTQDTWRTLTWKVKRHMHMSFLFPSHTHTHRSNKFKNDHWVLPPVNSVYALGWCLISRRWQTRLKRWHTQSCFVFHGCAARGRCWAFHLARKGVYKVTK